MKTDAAIFIAASVAEVQLSTLDSGLRASQLF